MRSFCRALLPLLVIGLALVGCDSGGTEVPNDLGDSTTVAFTMPSSMVGEADGSYTVEVEATDPGHKEFSVGVSVDQSQSTVSVGEDISGLPGDTTLTFPESATDGQTRSLSFEVIDDLMEEGDEEIVLSLSAADTSGISIGEPSTFTLTIQENDLLVVDFSDEELAPMMSYSVASNENWEVSSEGDPPSAPYAVASGFGADEASNDWLITPALNFNDVEGETLTFLNAKGFDDTGRRGLQVKVSTDYDGSGNPEDFSWTDVSDQVTFSEGDFNFVGSGEVDLSGAEFQGDAVYVAFQYQSTSPDNAASWEVDDIVVLGQ